MQIEVRYPTVVDKSAPLADRYQYAPYAVITIAGKSIKVSKEEADEFSEFINKALLYDEQNGKTNS